MRRASVVCYVFAAVAIAVGAAGRGREAGQARRDALHDEDGVPATDDVAPRGALLTAVVDVGPEVVEILIDHGADVNARNHRGETPLHEAARRGRDTVVEVLLQRGADANARCSGGRTPLHEAACPGSSVGTMQLLLEHGADVGAKDRWGTRPMDELVGGADPQEWRCSPGFEAESYWDGDEALIFCIDYRYDPAGNRTHRIHQPAESGRIRNTVYYEYNELNQLTKARELEQESAEATLLIGATYFEYDLNGNMTKRAAVDDAGALVAVTCYDWDYDDQLVEAEPLVGTPNTFAYDGGFQRVEREDSRGTRRYHWDGLNVIVERDGGDATAATHTHGPAPEGTDGAAWRIKGLSQTQLWFFNCPNYLAAHAEGLLVPREALGR